MFDVISKLPCSLNLVYGFDVPFLQHICFYWRPSAFIGTTDLLPLAPATCFHLLPLAQGQTCFRLHASAQTYFHWHRITLALAHFCVAPAQFCVAQFCVAHFCTCCTCSILCCSVLCCIYIDHLHFPLALPIGTCSLALPLARAQARTLRWIPCRRSAR